MSTSSIKNDFRCDYPCTDIKKGMIFPRIEFDAEKIKLVMISEAPPVNRSDYFYESNSGSFFHTTKMAFEDAGDSFNIEKSKRKMIAEDIKKLLIV